MLSSVYSLMLSECNINVYFDFTGAAFCSSDRNADNISILLFIVQAIAAASTNQYADEYSTHMTSWSVNLKCCV